MKNFYFRSSCLAIILLLIFAVNVAAQESKVQVDGWEVRLNRLQPPEKIMDVIGLKKGMSIGDIGAGRGRFTVWFADRVGENGKVYANDISKRSLDYLKRRCEKNNIENVVIILGKVTDPCFEENSLDIAFMINVYHHLVKPVELVKNVFPSLKPDGILAIVEHDPVKSGYSLAESTPKKTMLEQLDAAGIKVIRIESFLKNDYIYICRPKVVEKQE